MAEQNQSGATNTSSPSISSVDNTSIVSINKQPNTTQLPENTKLNIIQPQATLPSFRRAISFNPPKLRTVDEYEKQGKIGQGTYGRVYKARCRRTDKLVALKQIRIKDNEDGLSITTIREIKILKSLNHENVIKLIEIVLETPIEYSKEVDCIYMVFEYMEHDLSGLAQCEGNSLQHGQIRCYIKQLLEGLSYCHRNKILHRDIKGANMLINNQGVLKLADFGLARRERENNPQYTNKVVTLWYRAPELLLGSYNYGPSIDMWSVGCILVELYTRRPAFPAASEPEQLDKIFSACGTPDESTWPGVSQLRDFKNLMPAVRYPRQLDKFLGPSVGQETLNLIEELLTLDPTKRITADNALIHKYFFATNGKFDPPPRAEELPKYSSSYHEMDAKKLRSQKMNNSNALKRQKDNMGNSLSINHNYNGGRPPFGGAGGSMVPRGAHAPFGQRNPEYRIPPRGNFQRGGYHSQRGAGPSNGMGSGAPNQRGNSRGGGGGGAPIPSDRGGSYRGSSSGSHGYPPPATSSGNSYSRSSSSSSSSRYDGANGSRENSNNNTNSNISGNGSSTQSSSKDPSVLPPPPISISGEKRRRDD